MKPLKFDTGRLFRHYFIYPIEESQIPKAEALLCEILPVKGIKTIHKIDDVRRWIDSLPKYEPYDWQGEIPAFKTKLVVTGMILTLNPSSYNKEIVEHMEKELNIEGTKECDVRYYPSAEFADSIDSPLFPTLRVD